MLKPHKPDLILAVFCVYVGLSSNTNVESFAQTDSIKGSKGLTFDHIPGGHSFTRFYHGGQNLPKVKYNIQEKNKALHLMRLWNQERHRQKLQTRVTNSLLYLQQTLSERMRSHLPASFIDDQPRSPEVGLSAAGQQKHDKHNQSASGEFE